MKNFKLDGITLSITGWAKKAKISRQAMARRLSEANTPAEMRRALTGQANQGKRTDRERKRLKKAKAIVAGQ